LRKNDFFGIKKACQAIKNLTGFKKTLKPICVKFDNTTGQAPLLLIVLKAR
jgi:hypothetical protein